MPTTHSNTHKYKVLINNKSNVNKGNNIKNHSHPSIHPSKKGVAHVILVAIEIFFFIFKFSKIIIMKKNVRNDDDDDNS